MNEVPRLADPERAPTDWNGRRDAAAHPAALCRRAALPAGRAGRRADLGRLPRLPAGDDARQRPARLHADRDPARCRFPAQRPVHRSRDAQGLRRRCGARRRRYRRRRARRGDRAIWRGGSRPPLRRGAGCACATRSRPIRRCSSAAATFWLPASSDIDMAAKGDGVPEIGAAVPRSSTPRARSRPASTATFLTGADATDPTVVGIWGAFKGSLLTMLVTLAARLPDRRAVGALSRGICAAEPLDRPDRGVDQQSRRGALDHLRPARPRGVPQRHASAALGAARRRPDAGADDHAGDRHRRPQRDQVGAAVDPRRRARHRRSRASRSSSTMFCRSRCPASSPARSSAWRARWARPRRC